MTLAILGTQQGVVLPTISSAQSSSDLILGFFERNKKGIEEKISFHFRRTRPEDRENLTFENVQNEVFIRASKFKPHELTDRKLQNILFGVLLDHGKSSVRSEKRPLICTSQILSPEARTDYILDDPNNPLVRDNSKPSIQSIKRQRRKLAVLKTFLSSFQLETLREVRRGKTAELIAEQRDKSTNNIKRCVRRAAACMESSISLLKTSGESEALTVDEITSSPSFKALQPAIRTAFEMYLRGSTASEVSTELNLSPGTIYGYLYEGRSLLYIPQNNAERIHRENRNLKFNSLEENVKQKTLEFFFWDHIPKKEDKELLYQTTKKLFDFLSPIQRHDLESHLRGKLQKEIAKERNVGRGSIRESLIRSRDVVLRKLDQLKSVPDGIDPFQFIALDDYLQEKLILYFKGLSHDEIAVKTCNTKKDVIQHLSLGRKLLGLSLEEAEKLKIPKTNLT